MQKINIFQTTLMHKSHIFQGSFPQIAADNKKANDLRIVRFSTQLLFSEPQVVIHQNHVNASGMAGKSGDEELAADGVR